MAADLELAAAQLCLHLDRAAIGSRRSFLLATRDTLDRRNGQVRYLAPVHRDPGTGAASYGEWTAADDVAAALRELR